MPLFSFEGHQPQIHPTAWIAPTASIIGDVTIEENASVWFNVVIRADFGPIAIRAGANVQDGSVIHGDTPLTEIGPGVTVGHACMIHGATIGRQALIGNGAVVLDGAVIGERSIIAAGSVVAPGTVIPPAMMAVGTPARVTRAPSEKAQGWIEESSGIYRDLARRYASELVEIEDGRPTG
jgi:carbonic anhydrase/acetyltransferase-like protein (isoleucine patch superfamily)